MRRILSAAAAVALLASASAASAFDPQSLVWKKCTGCHAPAADGRIARVEDLRTTPEEWTVIVDRMRRIHGMPLTRAEMDTLLKELCATQILTPEEQAKVSYLSLFHNSQQLEAPADPQEERLFATCVRCHSAGKIRSYRMTEAGWAKLRDFHLFVDPAIVFQMREMHWREEAAAVLGELAKALPYGRAWSAPAARLEGRWVISGYEPGKGTYRGEAEVTGGAGGEYRLKGTLRYADRTSEPFEGEATLYGGYALRTRTRHAGVETRGAYILSGGELRGESHFPAPRFRTSAATWVRADGGPRVVRVSPGFLLSGEKASLTVEGVDLPAVTAADVVFTGGTVKVLSAKRLASGAIALQVSATAPKLAAARLAVKGLDAGPVVLAPRIDRIAVTPATGRARLAGGTHYPAEGVQFEAIAYAKGPPAGEEQAALAVVPAAAKPGDATADVALGPVPATFALAEEKTRDGDDDLRWIRPIAANGSYVPKGDYGPVPARPFSMEGSGLVKVIATYRRGAKTYRAEAQLAVTVPDYVQRIR
jgi:quinohemoprotein amine dehydrogenase